MITSGIKFLNFKKKLNSSKVKKNSKIIENNNQLILSLSSNYKNSFKKKQLSSYKKYNDFRLIGMGGSILGAQTIYDFLKKNKKKFFIC